MKNSIFKENQLSWFSQGAIYVLISALCALCVLNIINGEAPNPYYFVIVISGFSLFVIAKYSVISKGIQFSFGTETMSPMMANLYRLGYWLMMVGTVFTFAG